MNESFATVLNCMDGRVQVPVILYLLDRFGVDHIDTITEAGIVRYLSDDTNTPHAESTLHSTRVSLEKHGSRQIAVVAHADCSGNPIPPEQQQTQIRVAVENLKDHFPQCDVLGLWVDDSWQVLEIVSTA